MAGVKCMEVNWGTENLPCYRGEGTLSTGREKRERVTGVERVQHCGFTRRNLSDPETGELGN